MSKRGFFLVLGIAFLVASFCLLPQGILGLMKRFPGAGLVPVVLGSIFLVVGVICLWLGRRAHRRTYVPPSGRLQEDPLSRLPPGGVIVWGKEGVDGIIHSKSSDFDE